MSTCEINPNSNEPVWSTSFWMVTFLIWADLSLTITGITQNVGSELNPLYAPFTETGVLAMLIGAVIYFFSVLVWFSVSPNWVRAMTGGFLTGIHVFGALSWLQIYVNELGPYLNPWTQLIGAAFLGSFVTIFTYVEIRTCPGI